MINFNFIKSLLFGLIIFSSVRASYSRTQGEFPAERSDSLSQRELPGKTEREMFTPEQDSVFIEALRLQMPALSRLKLDLNASEALWHITNTTNNDTWARAYRTMSSIDPSWYIASGIEQVQHDINIMNAFYIRGVRTYNPGMGLSIPLSSIASLLGIVEDVSPELKYNLEYPANVEIVVYSVQAIIIATLFNAPQTEGSYKITWNGRDNNGKKMPSGDYIGEVRVGKDKIIRKRIKID